MKKTSIFIISAIFLSGHVAAHEHATESMAVESMAAPAMETTTESNQIGKMPALESAVGKYVTAWQQSDYKTMLPYENWEGGDSLNETAYIQAFDGNFHISDWKITKVEDVGNDQYKVLVLITHNPPTQVAALIPEGRTVRSTLIQFWKKQGEQFQHLYNVEKQKIWGQFEQNMPKK